MEIKFYFELNGQRLPDKNIEILTMKELEDLMKSVPDLKLKCEKIRGKSR